MSSIGDLSELWPLVLALFVSGWILIGFVSWIWELWFEWVTGQPPISRKKALEYLGLMILMGPITLIIVITATIDTLFTKLSWGEWWEGPVYKQKSKSKEDEKFDFE